MIKRLRILIAVLVVAAVPVHIQAAGPINITTQDAGACATANACATFTFNTNALGTIDISGTWTGTLSFEGTVNDVDWRTVTVMALDYSTATSTTANGSFTVNNVGFSQVRVRATAAMTGTAVVYIRAGYARLGLIGGPVVLGNGTSMPALTTQGAVAAATEFGDTITPQAYIGRTLTSPTGQVRPTGLLVYQQLNFSSAPSPASVNYGLFTQTEILATDAGVTGGRAGTAALVNRKAAPTSTSYGWIASASHWGTGTITGLVGAYSRASVYSDGAATTATGQSALVEGAGAGSVGTGYVYDASAFFDTASLGAVYAYHVASMTNITTPWAFYAESGTGPSRFADGFHVTTLAASGTAPTIASGGCTSPAVTHNNGTAAFLVTIGTSCTGVKTITLTMPAAAHLWSCAGDNTTSDSQQQSNYLIARPTSTTAVVLTSYDRTTNVQEDFTASDTYLVHCLGE